MEKHYKIHIAHPHITPSFTRTIVSSDTFQGSNASHKPGQKGRPCNPKYVLGEVTNFDATELKVSKHNMAGYKCLI
jgi:hypothetical protein